MGKGDRKTKRGKIIKGSSGVKRSKKKNETSIITDNKATKEKELKKKAVSKKKTEEKLPVDKDKVEKAEKAEKADKKEE